MPFLPSMTPDQIKDLDERRGRGDDSTNYTNPDGIKNKKPWYNSNGTHKAISDKINNKNNSLKSMDNKKVEELLDFEKKEHGHIPSPSEEKDECKDDMKKDMYMGSPGGSNSGGTMGSMTPSTPPPVVKAIDILKNMPKFEKALNTKSFRPIGLPGYTGDTVVRNATAVHFTPVDWNTSFEPVRNPAETLKSCHVHGIIYKSDNGCTPCNIAKSMMCKNCGGQMHKGPGGSMVCPTHG